MLCTNVTWTIYCNSFNFRCKNISVRRKHTKLLYSNFCYKEYFSDQYLEQSTCVYAVHAVFVALWILEGYGWKHVYPLILKANRRSIRSERIAFHHHSICCYSICYLNREDRQLTELGGHTPRYCTAYRRGNFSHSKPSPSLPAWRHDHSMCVQFMTHV